MPTFAHNIKKTARSEVTRSLLQGSFGVVFFWLVLTYLVKSNTPHPAFVIANFTYTVFITFFCNYKMITGRWTAVRWANRSLAFAMPLPIFYGYFSYLDPDYFAVIVIFVLGIELPVLGLATSLFLNIWIVTYYSVFLVPLFLFKYDYLQAHWVQLSVFMAGYFFLHFWLVRASNSVKRMGSQLTRHLVETKQHKRNLSKLHQMLKIDLTLARRLQLDTLPNISHFHSRELQVAAKYLSLETVGGDLYDLVDLGNGRTGLFIADVSGHGVAAALVTMMTKTAFRNHCFECERPDQLLREINSALHGMLERQDFFVTAFYCILDGEGTLHFSSAGHQPILIIRKEEGKVFGLSTVDTFFLGVEPDWKYRADTFRLHGNDKILLYTDGLIEAKNKLGDCYGDARFYQFILEKANLPAEEFLDAMMLDLHTFTAGRKPEDDIAIVCADFVSSIPILMESNSINDQIQ
ncbi:serine/threonine protein phosphatase [Leptospira perolatii]|uniref:Serine/threonine protein phosphatase n=1 Tax=Leptospira perolatii TaxID=2023191 RepID=A0A2M9ZJM4_9LEPT|nr:PP2C family protein-serine/threonine phosphatase [Leptospira perolatii]PJZ68832.1 serine/threonine protein phosphatase [Leptospira perolatii]PJZ72163.1 serine/threonine protein phosphatase [Leptospira perolatii]